MHRSKRRRVASAVAERSLREAPSHCAIWLDRLPEDVCQRIAAHVSGREQNCDALALAKTSLVLRNAVLAVLRHRLFIHDKRWPTSFTWFRTDDNKAIWDTAKSREWISIMGDDIWELAQPYLASLSSRKPPRFILRVLSLPKLRHAQIMDDPAQVAAISRSSSIQDVVILLKGKMPANIVFEALSKMSLSRLLMMCGLRGPSPCCPFQDSQLNSSEGHTMARYLPHLTSLSVSCACDPDVTMFWDVLLSMRTLRHLQFRWYVSPREIPKKAIRFLSALDSVGIMEKHVHHLASLIGTSISEIDEGDYSCLPGCTAEQVLALRSLPQLRKFA